MKSRSRQFNAFLACIVLSLGCLLRVVWKFSHKTPDSLRVVTHREGILQTCAALKIPAGPPADFYSRKVSDRFQPGTKATLIRNATVWTGEGNATVVVSGDTLLDGSVIKAFGHIPSEMIPEMRAVEVYGAKGGWITPGLGGCPRPPRWSLILSDNGTVDIHNHMGVMSAPTLWGMYHFLFSCF